MSTFTLSFCSPKQTKICENLTLATLPSCEGEMGVLPRHATMTVELDPGIVALQPNAHYFIAGGVAHITPEKCVIITEHFQQASDVNPVILEEALQKHHDDLAGIEIDYKRRALEQQIHRLEQQIAAMKKIKVPTSR